VPFGYLNPARYCRSCPVSFSTAHSHIVKTVQPCDLSVEAFVRSLSMVRSNFLSQYSAFDDGLLPRIQSWPCQKQLLTNKTTLNRGNTTSGVPGKFLTCSLNRYPFVCNSLRTRHSNFECLLFTADITLDRCCDVMRSIISQFGFSISGYHGGRYLPLSMVDRQVSVAYARR
jgi:hypothetical protein